MPNSSTPTESTGRFGAFGGVFTPSLLTILGVIMYLRFGWIVGNVGLAAALSIVVIAHLISLVTGLSVASIATNREVGAGGAYYMISRSLGGPAGAAIGIPLFLAQALSVTFYIVGFSESLHAVLPHADPKIVGTLTCLFLFVISAKSADLAIKAQYVVMVAIGLSLISFFSGRLPDAPSSITWVNENGASFATVFAVFFPAVTGIMAGVSMSGDLKNPRRDLPLGTLSAIGVGFVVYMVFPIWLSINASNDVLINDLDIVWKISRFPSLIFLGVWGATLSSAIGSILSAPRTLQAVAADGMAPRVFSFGHGQNNEPRNGLFLTFILAEAGVLVGSLDLIAPVLTMFFLATYGVTNLACALEKWAANPSFRPSFSVPWWISLLGAVACFWIMSIIDMVAMLVAIIFCLGVFLHAQKRSFDTTFGDARHGFWAALAGTALHKLKNVDFHPSNWRPNLIIFGGSLHRRSHLLELGAGVVQQRGIVSFVQLLQGDVGTMADDRQQRWQTLNDQLSQVYPNVFCRVETTSDIHPGVVLVTQSYGVGTFEANTVLLGWPTSETIEESYLKMCRDLKKLDRSLLTLRYKSDRGFGWRKQIDIWWGGLEQNGALMLLLAFLLNSDERWQGAKVRVITMVGNSQRKEQAEASLRTVLERTRLHAESRVIVKGNRSLGELMKEESTNTDLSMIGLQIFEKDVAASFYDRYNRILDNLPTTLMVSSGDSFQGAPVLFETPESE